jgi:hypothetical protein
MRMTEGSRFRECTYKQDCSSEEPACPMVLPALGRGHRQTTSEPHLDRSTSVHFVNDRK